MRPCARLPFSRPPLRSMARPSATMSLSGLAGALSPYRDAALQGMSPTLLGHDVVTGPRLCRASGEHRCLTVATMASLGAARLGLAAVLSCSTRSAVQISLFTT